MTRDELRALIGGYATGSLSAAEREALFAAALDDQELFDELAREQALKESIEIPGARERLLASLEPAVPWWRRRWVWIAAAAWIVAGAVFLWRPSPHPEIARIEPPPVGQPAAPAPQVAPPAAAQPKLPARRAASRRIPKAAPAPKAEIRASPVAPVNGRAIGGLRPLQAPAMSPMRAAPFGFDYSADWTGDVSVTVTAAGYLRVFSGSGGALARLYPLSGDGGVTAQSTIRLAVPPGADALVLQFAASEPAQDTLPVPARRTSQIRGAMRGPDMPSTDLVIRIEK